MTDGELQVAINVLDRLPHQLTTDADRKRRERFLPAILGGIRERGGSFKWNRVEYRERTVGVLSPWDCRLDDHGRGAKRQRVASAVPWFLLLQPFK